MGLVWVLHAPSDGLLSRSFLSRNYWLINAPRKFDVLKTNTSPRSEASRANMLVTIRVIVPRQTSYCLECTPLSFLLAPVQVSDWIISTLLLHTKHLNSGPLGNGKFCFPSNGHVPEIMLVSLTDHLPGKCAISLATKGSRNYQSTAAEARQFSKR